MQEICYYFYTATSSTQVASTSCENVQNSPLLTGNPDLTLSLAILGSLFTVFLIVYAFRI